MNILEYMKPFNIPNLLDTREKMFDLALVSMKTCSYISVTSGTLPWSFMIVRKKCPQH